ncbi:very short patch repair endonuclease [Parvibaculum sp.]|uniref:very short patch repair endonuclease n=1 Tax=Parvibaculum sp. TaxID=2024848 RepID=UPI0038B2A30B
MADKLTPARRSENMSRIRSTETRPELHVRKLVRSLGYSGYRLHRKDLPGKPDIAFIGRKKAIFVHGCFWHQHPDPGCLDGRLPKSRQEYWLPKLERNQKRDATAFKQLVEAGWTVLVIWECDLRREAELTKKIQKFLAN